jgi:hypothetical protein
MRAFTDARSDWLTVVHLPAYAPDVNAVEGAWASMKSSLSTHAAPPLTNSKSWSAHIFAQPSDAPTSSMRSAARPDSPSKLGRPSPESLAFQPL